MVTYEVKITIDPDVEDDWLNWMKMVHVPNVIATGYIKSYQILIPLHDLEHTYLFQYQFGNMDDYTSYQEKHSPALREEVLELYDGKFQSQRQLYRWA